MFENLPELENFMQEDTKTAITSTARYICDKFERIHDTFFKKNMVVFLKSYWSTRAKSLRWYYLSVDILELYFFHVVVNCICRTSLYNLMMLTSECHSLDILFSSYLLQAFTCSKSTIKTLENYLKYVRS